MADKRPINKPPSLSLTDLAKRLGLAKSTVSRALSGTGRVAPATRERVRREAKRLGYQPDPMMSAFSRYRKQSGSFRGTVIALVMPGRETYQPNLNNEWAEPLGYRVEKFYLEDFGGAQAKLTRMLRARGINTAIFPEAPAPIVIQPEAWLNFHAVYCGPYPGDSCPFDTVRHNPFDTVQLAFERATAAGFRRIGLIFGHNPAGMTRSERKTLGGYTIAQRMAGTDHAELAPFVDAGPEILEADRGIRTWLDTHRPDCILGFVRVLQDTLARIGPEAAEIPFIALRMPPDDWDTNRAAGFRVGRLAIERLALRHLDGLIRSGDRHEGQPSRISVVVEPEWVPGASFPE